MSTIPAVIIQCSRSNRRVVVFRNSCFQYSVSHPYHSPVHVSVSLNAPLFQDVISFAKSTFGYLKNTDVEDIIIAGSGKECPWNGNAELSERTWSVYWSSLSEVIVYGMHPHWP